MARSDGSTGPKRDRGTLTILKPGESRRQRLSIHVVAERDEILDTVRRLGGVAAAAAFPRTRDRG